MCISVVGLVVLFVVDRVGARFFFRAIFVFNATATTEIYTYGHTLSLHDALPIYLVAFVGGGFRFLPDQIGDRGVETGLVFRLRDFGCGLLRRLFVPRRGQRPAERIGKPDQLPTAPLVHRGRAVGSLEAHIAADAIAQTQSAAARELPDLELTV